MMIMICAACAAAGCVAGFFAGKWHEVYKQSMELMRYERERRW